MLFYPSKTNDKLNTKPFHPESVNGLVMLNPNYPIKILLDANDPWYCAKCERWHKGPCAICDSGAFQHIKDGQRLMVHAALDRQLRLEEQIRWHNNNHDWHFESVCIYDQMAGVDETVVNGKKVKQRGTPETARKAVTQTLESAAYYNRQRHKIQGRIMFIGQGVTPDQYINDCLVPMLDYMQPGDYFGFGGFCIWGRMPKRITPIAHETILRALPLLWQCGIRRIHLLGVMYAPAVEWVSTLINWINDVARKEGFICSTDGSGPEQAGTIAGCEYIKGRQVKAFTKEQKWIDYHPHDLAMDNIREYHQWASAL
jgi:hypothetical protein